MACVQPGSVIRFDGFLRIYEEGIDDAVGDDGALPALTKGEALDPRKIEAKQHFTEPPPRYTEATLIKKMEELGIGRPSTYATTLNVLRDREYVRLDKKRLYPEDKGRLVTAFLESFFRRYVEYDFTADLEEKLDLISAGKLEWKDVLRDFWREFIAAVNDIGDLRIAQVLEALNELLGPHIFPEPQDGGDPRACPSCTNGRLSLKVGKFGAFIGCSNYPECRYTRQLADTNGEKASLAGEAKVLGTDPETGLESRCAPAASVLMSNLARAMARRSPSGLRSRRAPTPSILILSARSRFSRCLARSASILRPESPSWRASAAMDLMFSTTANMRASARPRRCSKSESIAR
jgi:DNA topoisomerase-1